MEAVQLVSNVLINQFEAEDIIVILSLGPVLVSTSVIQDPQTLSIKAIYDGKTVQDGHTR